MNVLAVGAHLDDVELGCGATLAAHALRGDAVSILALSYGVMSRLGSVRFDEIARRNEIARKDAGDLAAVALGATLLPVVGLPDQRFDTQPLLDIIRAIEVHGEAVMPDVVYTHSMADLNEDHRITAQAVLTAFRPIRTWPRRILAFEVPSSTEWGATPFRPVSFVDVSAGALTRKLSALRHYVGEMRQFPHPRSEAAIRALAAWRGATAGFEAAEAFEVLRERG